MKVLITGAGGFIGRNLRLYLDERQDIEVSCFTRDHSIDLLQALVADADFVFHLAGVNRPEDPAEFVSGNTDLTYSLCEAIAAVAESDGRAVPVVYTSSIQAAFDNPYGRSKQAAEGRLFDLQAETGAPVHVFRLPNVFGKWCRPNYNSVVATFCHNIARGLPVQVHDATAKLSLVYVDDIAEEFIRLMDGGEPVLDGDGFAIVFPQYGTTVGELADILRGFRAGRDALTIDRVGTGLVRALYATYLSYLPMESFSYEVLRHEDARGSFVEMLKTPDCGQFSFFTAHPGITRGGHYHHTKTEKFLVIQGEARFRFRNMKTGERHELSTSGNRPEIVETIPGWAHDITNVGTGEMIVLLWANEVFDRERPDTYAASL